MSDVCRNTNLLFGNGDCECGDLVNRVPAKV